MEKEKIDRMTLFFDASDREAAAVIGRAAAESLGLVRALLGLVPGTASALARTPGRSLRRRTPAFSARDPEEFIRCFVLGYWRVRFLEETRPGLLKKLLAEDFRPGEWSEPLAAAYQGGPGPAWENLDRLAAAHFQNVAAGSR
jgi:hypothetical protein